MATTDFPYNITCNGTYRRIYNIKFHYKPCSGISIINSNGHRSISLSPTADNGPSIHPIEYQPSDYGMYPTISNVDCSTTCN